MNISKLSISPYSDIFFLLFWAQGDSQLNFDTVLVKLKELLLNSLFQVKICHLSQLYLYACQLEIRLKFTDRMQSHLHTSSGIEWFVSLICFFAVYKQQTSPQLHR